MKAMREAEDERFIHKTLSTEAFQRINSRYEEQLKNIEYQSVEVTKDYSKSLKVLEEILLLSENIGQAYIDALYPQKRKYLSLFFKKFIVDGDEIIKYELSDDLKELIENQSVRVRRTGLQRLDQVRTFIKSPLGFHHNQLVFRWVIFLYGYSRGQRFLQLIY